MYRYAAKEQFNKLPFLLTAPPPTCLLRLPGDYCHTGTQLQNCSHNDITDDDNNPRFYEAGPFTKLA